MSSSPMGHATGPGSHDYHTRRLSADHGVAAAFFLPHLQCRV